MSTELHRLFHSRSTNESKQSPPSSTSTTAPGTSGSSRSERMLSNASMLCNKIRPGKGIQSRRKTYKPYKCPMGKEVQKTLVLIDYQGDQPSEVMPLKEYEKLYDGCIRYQSNMSEFQIRKEIVRLVRQKEVPLMTLTGWRKTSTLSKLPIVECEL